MGDATITTSDGIVADGTIYQFKVNAQNSFGVSDLSDFVLAAMSDFPDYLFNLDLTKSSNSN